MCPGSLVPSGRTIPRSDHVSPPTLTPLSLADAALCMHGTRYTASGHEASSLCKRNFGAAPPPRSHEMPELVAAASIPEPDDAPIAPGSRSHRPRRIAAAEDSDDDSAVAPAAEEMAYDFMRLATTCSSDGTPAGLRHGGGDLTNTGRKTVGRNDTVAAPWDGALADGAAEHDPAAQIEVHELKIVPQRGW